MSKVLVLDPGHSHNNTANSSPDNSYYEWKFAQDVVDIAVELSAHIPGLTVLKTKSATDIKSLTERVAFSNSKNADLFISIHSNALGDGDTWNSANGFGVYRYPGASLDTAQIAQKWLKNYIGSYMNDRGIKEANFYVLRETDCSSSLWEVGFHTNYNDVQDLKQWSFRILIATAVLRSGCEKLGVQYVEYKEDENVIMSKYVRASSTNSSMSKIASSNGLSLNQLIGFNPHVTNTSLIYAEFGGDIIFVENPNSFEIQFAQMNRDLILAKKGASSTTEITALKSQITQLQNNVAQLSGQVNTLTANLALANNKSTVLQNEVNALNGKITIVRNAIA